MKVYLVGIGMGNTLTEEAREAIQKASCLIGARRMLEAVSSEAEKIEAIQAADIAKIIGSTRHESVAVLYSGDIGFYSGAKQLLPLLSGCEVACICGVSSVQYLCAKLQRPWQDMKLVSVHGRNADVLLPVMQNRECFFLTDKTSTPAKICSELTRAGLGGAKVSVGECLSYPNEKITTATAQELCEREFEALCAMVVDNPFVQEETTLHGREDGCFLRGKVPMTKQEVRSVALCKLRLKSTDIAYDIGGGTGAVSVEMAGLCARVYAVECKEQALALMEKNRKKFGAYNMEIVAGTAPEVLAGLPAPDAVFIGGSRGNLVEILQTLEKKNRNTRVLITAVTLETLGQAVAALSGYGSPSVSQISANRSRKLGRYNMMEAENPIWLIHGSLGEVQV